MFGKSKIEVNAIIDSDIENLLRETSQYENIIKGEYKCKSCGIVITPENIGIIIPKHDDFGLHLDFYCEKVNCMDEYKING